MKLLFLHGWGFDAPLWDTVRAALPEFATLAWDRGYFGPAVQGLPDGPFLAVGHSLGSMLLAKDPPPGCVGLVAINGFDRFAGPGRVPARVVSRMQAQFDEAPERVLGDFRARIGVGAAPAAFDVERLARDLELLASTQPPLPGREGFGAGSPQRSAECAVSGFTPPTPNPSLPGRGVRLVLHGVHDPLLPPAMRDAVFPGAPRVTHPDAGHLLPLTHPEWCAEQLREVMACA